MDHPEHRWFVCMVCGSGYSSKLAAEDCADQDALEADDRDRVRLYRSNN